MLALLCPVAASLAAEGTQRLQPRELPQAKPGELISPEPPMVSATAGRAEILVDALRGLVLFDDAEELQESTKQAGVNTDKLEFPARSKLAETLSAYLGSPLTLNLLDKINREIVAFGRAHDRPVVDAFAPQGQDISNGVVQIVVVAARRGEIRVEGLEGGAAQRIAEQSRLLRGDVISALALRQELDWLNQNPFRSVDIILERGAEFGETDIVYAVATRRLYRLYGGVEDSGSRISGKERWFSGINWGDVFGLGHQASYQFTSSFDLEQVNAHSFSYLIPLDWRHRFEISAVHVESSPDVTASGFELQGTAWELGFRYSIPLASFSNGSHEFELGYDFKAADNDLEFGAIRVSDTQTSISQFLASYRFSFSDRFGNNTGRIRLVVSPGDMTSDNSDASFSASRFAASSDYAYFEGRFSRVTPLTRWLPFGASLFSELVMQYANENLLASEQLAVGGYRSVRGYDDFEVTGEIGLYARNELRGAAIPLLNALRPAIVDQLLPLIFTDYGVAKSKNRLPGEPIAHLWSAGLGFRYQVASFLNFRFDYGWQLKDIPTSQAGAGRMHAALMLSY